MIRNYSWFSHEVTKIQTKKLSLLLSFYSPLILEHLKTFIQTDFRFKRVLCFAIQDGAFSCRPGKLLCRLKHYGFLEILLSKHSLSKNNIALIFKNSRISRKTQKLMFLLVSGGQICAPERDANMASPYKALQIWV